MTKLSTLILLALALSGCEARHALSVSAHPTVSRPADSPGIILW